jgi:Ala-tRNA(Pro) deacylase
MEISSTLECFLNEKGIAYSRLHHHHSSSSLSTAQEARVPGNEMAKPVILEDEQGYVMAVIPATRQLKIRELNRLLNRNLGLATEPELRTLFKDCELGAIPPVGQAYGLPTIVDSSLNDCCDIYLESGNHEDVIHVRDTEFRKLMRDARQASICLH